MRKWKPNTEQRRLIKQAQEAGERKKKRTACNGSGRYDNTGSPKCGACNGTGVEPR